MSIALVILLFSYSTIYFTNIHNSSLWNFKNTLQKLPECSVGELPLHKTLSCQLNGYTCTEEDGAKCCLGRKAETRPCVPCDETRHKKPSNSIYTSNDTCQYIQGYELHKMLLRFRSHAFH